MLFNHTHKDQMLFAAKALAFVCLMSLTAPQRAEAQSLRGSRGSLDRQVAAATAHDFSYLKNANDVDRFAAAGLLVPVRGNADYTLKDVSFAYARPEVKLFVERLAAQFRAGCGERLVVTSLTRPTRNQPRNASLRSVHPTGMALDIRRHDTPACRQWLDRVLLSLEGSGVLEATLERRPPHYHIALFPRPYTDYVARVTGQQPRLESGSFTDVLAYQVGRKDTLWRIAQRHGTTPQAIQRANGLASTTIYPGQVLKVPVEPQPE
jgi:hypothetical protein